jgi:hypothetical protein
MIAGELRRRLVLSLLDRVIGSEQTPQFDSVAANDPGERHAGYLAAKK